MKTFKEYYKSKVEEDNKPEPKKKRISSSPAGGAHDLDRTLRKGDKYVDKLRRGASRMIRRQAGEVPQKNVVQQQTKELEKMHPSDREPYLRRLGLAETREAPKGKHYTKSGQLRKGDADVDGRGGPKFRSDPTDRKNYGPRNESKKADRCKRKADSVYGKKTSAYKSGAIVRCRSGKIWKKK